MTNVKRDNVVERGVELNPKNVNMWYSGTQSREDCITYTVICPVFKKKQQQKLNKPALKITIPSAILYILLN